MPTIRLPSSLAEAEALDAIDPLSSLRARFVLSPDEIYLDGHSLGPATHSALARVDQTMRTDWAQGLIRSWNGAGWIDLAERVGARLARLMGAAPDEVIICDSVSVNLFKLAGAALAFSRVRRVMVEADDFPTDQYVLDGLAKLSGVEVVRLPAGAGLFALKEGGVLVKSLAHYRTAALADIARHEDAAHAGNGWVVWDLSHAIGVVAMDLKRDGARLATGCTYKHLNGGPGAPAFVFVDNAIASVLRSPLSGWFGHADPFAFSSAYHPREGAARFAAGTPGILSLVALDGALDALADVTAEALQEKARALSALFLARAEALGLASPTPRDPAARGGHVTLHHPDGYAIIQALIARGVIGDFRAPDAMRFAVSPAFLRHADIWRAADALEDMLRSETYRDPQYAVRARVT